MPIHPSFTSSRNLSSGELWISDIYPDVCVRFSECPQRPEQIAQSTLLEIGRLSTLGIASVRPRAVIVEDGIAYICDRLYGTNLEDELQGGNREATQQYGSTLRSLSHYYLNALSRIDTPVAIDIVAPHQFTWNNNEIILHDITDAFSADPKAVNEMILLNVSDIAAEYARFFDGIDTTSAREIHEKMSSILCIFEQSIQHRIEYRKKSILLVKLVIEAENNSKVLTTLYEAYKSDCFFD